MEPEKSDGVVEIVLKNFYKQLSFIRQFCLLSECLSHAKHFRDNVKTYLVYYVHFFIFNMLR